jgi:hypothetical protein
MTTRTLSIATLHAYGACRLDTRIADLEAHLTRPVAADEPIPLSTWAAVTPDLSDLTWVLRCFWDGAELAGQVAEHAVGIAQRAEDGLPCTLEGSARQEAERARQHATSAIHALRGAESAHTVTRAAVCAGDAVSNALDAVWYAALATDTSAYDNTRTARDDIRAFTLKLLGVLP